MFEASERLKSAQNPTTPVETLKKLAALEDRAILEAIASNPNSPLELLIQLAGDYLAEIGKNPALELILSKQANALDCLLDRYEAKHFYARWSIPPSFLPFAAKSSSPVRRLTVAINDATPHHILEKLAEDPIDLVRTAAKKQLGFDSVPIAEIESSQTWIEDEQIVNQALMPPQSKKRFNALTFWRYQDFLIEIELPILYRDIESALTDVLNFQTLKPIENGQEFYDFYLESEPNFLFFDRNGEDDIFFYDESVDFFQIASSDSKTGLPETVNLISLSLGEWLKQIDLEIEFKYIAYAIKEGNGKVICYKNANIARSFTLSAKNNLS